MVKKEAEARPLMGTIFLVIMWCAGVEHPKKSVIRDLKRTWRVVGVTSKLIMKMCIQISTGVQ